MNTNQYYNINIEEFETPFDFSTTRSAYTYTPPSYSSTSPIPSISSEQSIPIIPLFIEPYNLGNIEISDRNSEIFEEPCEDNNERFIEENMAQVIRWLGRLFETMNQNNNNNNARETKLVDIPIFRGGI